MNPSLTNVHKILGDLIAFDVLGGQSNLTIIDYIIQTLEPFGIEYHLVPNKELTKTSLFCRIGPAVDGGIILSGHTDVVPVEGQAWTSEPFVLMTRDDLLFGRGTCDMKGFIACCLASLPAFMEASLKKPVYFAFSYDEEIGCLAGSELATSIKNHYKERPKMAIVGEPSMMQPVIGHKGICVLETIIKGSAGHSSRIREEVSAIHSAAHLINWLIAKMEAMVEMGQTDSRFYPPHSTIHVGKISGGIAPNVIADLCTFYWDVRVIPNDKFETIIADFKAYCKEYEQKLQPVFSGTQIVTNEFHPPVPALGTNEDKSIVELIRKITGIQTLKTVAYASEAGQFSDVGFETVICGPGDIAQAHRADEFVSLDQLALCMEMLDNLIKEMSV